jgi:hypothetical protein
MQIGDYGLSHRVRGREKSSKKRVRDMDSDLSDLDEVLLARALKRR